MNGNQDIKFTQRYDPNATAAELHLYARIERLSQAHLRLSLETSSALEAMRARLDALEAGK